MRHPDRHDTLRISSSSSAAERRQLDRLKRKRRRRLIPLLVAISLMALLTIFAAASFGTDSPTSGAMPSTKSAGAVMDTGEQASIDAVARARSLRANEMGQVLVLMYHLIGYGDSQYNRTPEGFRQDIADLKAAGYYPINVRDMVGGHIDTPAGTSPVVITFDDSSGGQYRIEPGGELDPDCAVAIMQEAVEQGGWASRASFFPLLDVDAPDHIVFGQPELAEKKLRQLVSWGYEVGSHTVSHLNLEKASTSEAKKQLYRSKHALEEMIGGGYEVTSLAAPFGAYPAQSSILKSGEYDGQPYSYQAALKATGGPSFSPFSASFRAYHIPRIEVGGVGLNEALSLFERSPEVGYVSDGDPATVSLPDGLDPSLGSVRTGLGQEVIRY
jgi:peptidoglycan/xylan/chitin deacetylase (PgdA/CDA1 family)